MDRSVKMSTGMLDDMPPEQIEAVLLKVELALHLNAGLAHEGRKIGRHGMGKIHYSGEASGFRRVRGGRRRGKSGGGHTLEKAASTQGCPHRHFTPGDAHGFSILSAHYTCDYTAILFCKVDAGNRLADAGGLVAAIEPSAHFVGLRRIGDPRTAIPHFAALEAAQERWVAAPVAGCAKRRMQSYNPMLVIDDVSVRVAGRLLIERSTAQVPAGARVGLVGRNGTGKSTLFRAIAGDIAIEHGSFARPARATIGSLPQEAPAGPERLIDLVLTGDRERTSLLQEA